MSIRTDQVVFCDRCRRPAGMPSTGPMTAGYYTRGGWAKYLRPGEDHLCDTCMWQEPKYIADYGTRTLPANPVPTPTFIPIVLTPTWYYTCWSCGQWVPVNYPHLCPRPAMGYGW